MLEPKELFDFLRTNDVTFYSGVPDSLLKDFCLYIDNECQSKSTKSNF